MRTGNSSLANSAAKINAHLKYNISGLIEKSVSAQVPASHPDYFGNYFGVVGLVIGQRLWAPHSPGPRRFRTFSKFLASEQSPDTRDVADATAQLVATPAGKRPLRTVCGLGYPQSQSTNTPGRFKLRFCVQ